MSLTQINVRLKAGKVGVTIRQKGDRLYLRGTFPPKPGETEWKQRDISLGIYASPVGYKRAEIEAKKAGAQLADKVFTWTDWIDSPKPKSDTVSGWIERFEVDYFNRKRRNPKSETTWETEYDQVFRQLPPDEPLTAELLRSHILKTDPDTRNRQRYCMVSEALAKFAALPLDAKSLKGKYSAKSAKKLTPRDLPTDKEISEWRDRISNEQWQYAFGLMACYGLRNHELFHIDLERLKESPVLHLIEDAHGGGKTGARRVWALYPEWYDRWHLWDVSLLPQVTGRNNRELGHRVTQAFKRYGFRNPYNLRHCWAVRSIDFLSVELAAVQMGHSYQIHCDTYHHWISDEVHQRAYDAAMNRPDRPMPPP
ncbi:MAG: site-specific integrase [Phormidium tanganyikae FI6-MK23]|jgi:integrase|nr:site-specific integrase [Phormidium tanganyikae FI6-MK23]